ncbi:MAG: LptF/LptG family permease [Acidobacteria bacterium]|nr:LptF/LptG family permease [Acidobacteriota bacterium]
MNRINKLLLHAIAAPFAIALVVLTFVVTAREFGSLAELLLSRSASLGVLARIAGSILPAILIFSLPLSFLIGVLVGMSGLSGESQVLALRACGVPLRRLLVFILVLGGLVGAATAALSLWVMPRTNDWRRQVVAEIELSAGTTRIQPRVFYEDIPKMVVYLDDVSADRQRGSRIFLADSTDPRAPRAIVARSVLWMADAADRSMQLHLEQGASYATDPEHPDRDNVSHFKSTDISIELKKRDPVGARPAKVEELGSFELLRRAMTDGANSNVKELLEIHRRIALPLTVIPFALLGLTLGVSNPKSGRTFGLALSLLAVILFYMLFFNGLRLAGVGRIPPWMGAWGANILLTLAGWMLLGRMEKTFGLGHWLGRLSSPLLPRRRPGAPPGRLVSMDYALLKWAGRAVRRLFPRILDLHMLRGFSGFFLWSLASCASLFLLLTLFELMDDVIKNGIPTLSVLDYLFFLTPQILMFAIPVSVLLGILIHFGILEKNSEITALKAGGWSLYRLAVPILAAACVLSLGLFVLQDYVLPYANDRQDGLRNTILNKPPRSARRLERKWILGEGGRIYNYEYFDENKDAFVDLNVYDVDFDAVRIRRRIHASSARIRPDGFWTLTDGWSRNYDAGESAFETIRTATERFPEKASYFKREIFSPRESSKLTYLELARYIHYLKQAGYNAMELQVELHKKASFPLSCLVMALVGIPFSFAAGNRGAFFAIGISVAIAIAYWGVSGAFEAMGAYGILLPMLAAWAPNLLFGAAGCILLLKLRT